MKNRNLDVDALTATLARIKTSVPTMIYSDVRTACKLAYAIGYDEAKEERIEDIKLFEVHDGRRNNGKALHSETGG